MGQAIRFCAKLCLTKEEQAGFELVGLPRELDSILVDDVEPLVQNQRLHTEEPREAKEIEGFSIGVVLDKLSQSRKKFLEILHSDEGLELKVSKNTVNVWARETPDGFILKAVWKVPYFSEVYMPYLRDNSQKMSWDSNLEETRLICNLSSDISVSYQRYKKVTPVSSRDFIIASKLERLPGSLLNISASVESPLYPTNSVAVRARLLFGGYYLETIGEDEQSNITRVVSISETDFGGNLPKSLVKSMAAVKMSTFKASIDKALRKDLTK
jgi:hypothetical protein